MYASVHMCMYATTLVRVPVWHLLHGRVHLWHTEAIGEKKKGKGRYTPSLGSAYALWLLVGLLLGEIVACGKCECEATYNKHQRRYTIACLCKWLYLFDNLRYLDRKGLVGIL